MSGHSKWATTKHKKAAADSKRGKVFTKIGKEITVAAKLGGGDPGGNPRLRTAVAKAKSVSMPAENIKRAIQRGTGELPGVSYEEITYEGYGPHGVALLMQVVTDNKKRSVADLRRHVTRAGGTMGGGGAVGWQFTRKVYVTVPAVDDDPDNVFMLAADAGAEDVLRGEEEIEIFAPADKFHSVVQALDKAGIKIDESELRMEPNQKMELPPDQAVSVMRLIEQLEELDDVESVYTNLDFTDEALKAMQEAG